MRMRRYQKQLQLNYVQMYKKTKTLETEIDQGEMLLKYSLLNSKYFSLFLLYFWLLIRFECIFSLYTAQEVPGREQSKAGPVSQVKIVQQVLQVSRVSVLANHSREV